MYFSSLSRTCQNVKKLSAFLASKQGKSLTGSAPGDETVAQLEQSSSEQQDLEPAGPCWHEMLLFLDMRKNAFFKTVSNLFARSIETLNLKVRPPFLLGEVVDIFWLRGRGHWHQPEGVSGFSYQRSHLNSSVKVW